MPAIKTCLRERQRKQPSNLREVSWQLRHNMLT